MVGVSGRTWNGIERTVFEGKEKEGAKLGSRVELSFQRRIWRNKGYENSCFMMIEWEPVRTVSGHLSQRPCD